jgi:hypothetical protein
MTDDIVDRLRGRYSMGPILPSGEPEFGWRQFDGLPPINAEAADEIERLRAENARLIEEGTKRLEWVLGTIDHAKFLGVQYVRDWHMPNGDEP